MIFKWVFITFFLITVISAIFFYSKNPTPILSTNSLLKNTKNEIEISNNKIQDKKIKKNSLKDEDKIDDDNDGIPNSLELIIGTDKNNPDTDNDSYKDGMELINGYNPLGPGRGDSNDKKRSKNLNNKCHANQKIIFKKISPSKDLAKIDKIKYFSHKKQLLIVGEEKDSNRALWSFDQNNKYNRLIKLDKPFYHGFVDFDSNNNIYFRTNNPNLLYRSENYGKTWDLISDTLSPFWAITEDQKDNLYATAWSYNSPHIYKSEDKGKTWNIWRDFHEIFPEEAKHYRKEDERYKLRHLHDIIYYNNSLIVGTGDITRWTLLSENDGKTWNKIWNDGFTSHVLIPSKNIILLGGDKDGGFGIAVYNFNTQKTKRVWNPLDCGWSGFVHSMIEKNNKYYAAVQSENYNGLKYGVLMSQDGMEWRSILELTTDKNINSTFLSIAQGPQNIIYLSLNGDLYGFIAQ